MRDRLLRDRAPAQFLADALVDQHVGVDGHAQREGDGRDAGKGQRGLHHRQQRDQQHQVDRQREHRHDAEHRVIQAHEDRDGGKAPQRGSKARRDVLRPQAGADQAFLDDLHRRRQRSGPQQQGQVVGGLGGPQPGDLEARAELALDGGDGQHLAASLLERDLAHEPAGRLVQLDRHGRLLAFIERGLGPLQLLTGENHLLFQHHRRAAADRESLGAKRHRGPAQHRRLTLGTDIDQARLQRRGAADDVLGARRVLHARKLHHHPVSPLLLDHRLGHAQLVDPVVKGCDVLRQRIVLGCLQRGRGQRHGQHRIAAGSVLA